jgi:two-component system nitrogen regulation response regulator GlnG
MNAASKKILIADDDSSVRLVLSQAFTRLGYQVRATGNATTLLKWVTDGEGDLIITDVMMPDEQCLRPAAAHQAGTAGAADHRDECAKHLHDSDQAADAGAYDISAKAVRPEGTGRHCRPRPVAAPRRWQARANAADDDIPLIGRSPAMQDVYRAHRPADADRSHRDDQRRIRHRQGACRPRAARTGSSANGPFVAINMAAIPKRADRDRAVRP